MTKNIYITLISFIVLSRLWGCETAFLDEEPYSFVSPEVFYNTANDAEIGLNGVYRSLNDVWDKRYFFCANLGTDEMVYGLVKPENTPHAAYTYTPALGLQNELWMFYYRGINAANYLLENVPGIEMNEVRKGEIIGEAKFLRSFYYFNLAWLFGGVPLDITADVQTSLPRASLEQVYGFIIDELQQAYDLLPEQSHQYGKVNKDAAAAMLTKVSLYLASCKEYGTGQEVAAEFEKPELISFDWVDQAAMYKLAYDNALSIYGKYELIEKYDYLFLAETENEAKPENIFNIQFHVIESNPVYLAIHHCFYPKGKRDLGGGLNWNTPSGEQYLRFNRDMDFRGVHNITGELDKKNYTEFRGSIYFDVLEPKKTTISCGKWRHSSGESRINMPDWAADINMSVIRYADLLLMLAEATYKHLGDETAARQYITEVRLRAVMEGYTVDDLNNAYEEAELMSELLNERSRELCFEGWRRLDLIRTNTLEEKLMALDPAKTNYAKFNENVAITQANFEPYKIWFPIPLREMDLNKNMIQNPNW